jgi:hypothetical protein
MSKKAYIATHGWPIGSLCVVYGSCVLVRFYWPEGVVKLLLCGTSSSIGQRTKLDV